MGGEEAIGLNLPLTGRELVPPVLRYEIVYPTGRSTGVLNTLSSSPSPKRTINKGFLRGYYGSPSTPRKTKIQAQISVTSHSVLDNLGAR